MLTPAATSLTLSAMATIVGVVAAALEVTAVTAIAGEVAAGPGHACHESHGVRHHSGALDLDQRWNCRSGSAAGKGSALPARLRRRRNRVC